MAFLGRNNRATRRPTLPDPKDPYFLQALKERIEQLDGQRGDELDRGVTFRDLDDAGVAAGILSAGGQNGGGAGGGAGGGGGSVPPIVTVPPAVHGLQANAAYSRIALFWSSPGYQNHAYTEIHRAASDDISEAIQIGSSTGQSYVDVVGGDVTFFYWARNVSTAGVKGAFSASVSATTPVDVEWMLDKLTGEITESQLYQSLNERINLIDAEGTGLVDRMEVTETATSANAQQLTTLSATVEDNTAAIQVNADAVADLDGTVSATYTIKVDANGNIAAIGLMADEDGSEVAILADRLYIVEPGKDYTAPGTYVPFIVDDGKVWIDEAGIRQAAIKNAQIETLNVDKLTAIEARMPAAFIEEGSINMLQLSGVIESGSIEYDENNNLVFNSSYVPGVSGFKIDAGTGDAEFNNQRVRGLLHNGDLDSNGDPTGNSRYIDFRDDPPGTPASEQRNGNFVLGDVDGANFLSFEWDPDYNKRILRIRGDIALRNYEPGVYLLHANDATNEETQTCGQVLAAEGYTDWHDPDLFIVNAMTIVKETAVTRDGVLTVDFEFNGAGCAFYLCVYSDGDYKRVIPFYRDIGGNATSLGNSWYRSDKYNLAVKPGELIQVRYAHITLDPQEGNAIACETITGRGRNLRLYVGFYPEETSLL